MGIKQLKKRIKKAKKLQGKSAQATQSYHNLVEQGAVFEQQGFISEAVRFYKQALVINENAGDLCFQLAYIFINKNDFQEAEIYLRKGLAIEPDSEPMLFNLGKVLHELGQWQEAEVFYRRALALKPNKAKNHFQLGGLFENMGRISEAEECYRKALDLVPDFAYAHQRLAFLHKYQVVDEHLALMEKIYVADNFIEDQKMFMALGLGKAYEDLQSYDKAFALIDEANVLNRETFHYDIQLDRSFFENFINLFTEPYLAGMSGSGFFGESPIFIVGMPRSGTSLVEQILASHPDVVGGGELGFIQNVVEAQCEGIYTKRFFNNILGKESADFAAMGREYVEKVRNRLGFDPPGAVTDKLPGNFRFVGLIKLLLPKARIIHCRRHPMDTCLSIYKNFFSGYHPYAYNLTELGKYYLLYEQLMSHWQKVLPGFIYEISYEDILADQEGETRSLLEFCGLEWDRKCLEFHKTERTVATLSSRQVRKPIYKDSLKLWEKYGANLDPLKAELGDLV